MSAFTTQARHEGKCPECGDPIHEGDLLELVGGLGWCHLRCPIETEELYRSCGICHTLFTPSIECMCGENAG